MIDGLPKRISRDLAAGLLGCSGRTLQRLEKLCHGPEVVREVEGGRVVARYELEDVLAWRERSDVKRKPGRKPRAV